MNNNDINDNEIRIIGREPETPKQPQRWPLWVIIAGLLVALVMACVVLLRPHAPETSAVDADSSQALLTEDLSVNPEWMTTYDAQQPAATLFSDTVVDGIALTVMTPCNAKAELCVGLFDTNDASIIFATQAADIRHDNGKIVGAFVCKGEPKAWGLSKKGYCAIFDDRITVGVAENSPYFEQATEEGGYFFRQYPLVDCGRVVTNNPENESQRRALCQWNGQLHIIITDDRVTMNDFSSALAHLGVYNAIYLVGSTAYGWAIDPQGQKHSFSVCAPRRSANANYIIFRK